MSSTNCGAVTVWASMPSANSMINLMLGRPGDGLRHAADDKAEAGADIEHDRARRQGGAKHPDDIAFQIPAEQIGQRVERAQIHAEIFAARQLHQRALAVDPPERARRQHIPRRPIQIRAGRACFICAGSHPA
jgi:hypothetical protein